MLKSWELIKFNEKKNYVFTVTVWRDTFSKQTWRTRSLSGRGSGKSEVGRLAVFWFLRENCQLVLCWSYETQRRTTAETFLIDANTCCSQWWKFPDANGKANRLMLASSRKLEPGNEQSNKQRPLLGLWSWIYDHTVWRILRNDEDIGDKNTELPVLQWQANG